MIKLYHGSSVAVTEPLVSVGRRNLDFGNGFYLTRIKNQARKWAVLVASRQPETKGCVSIYEFDDNVLYSTDFRCRIFESYDIDWLNFVVACRKGKDKTKYDIIEGGVANDQVIDTVEDYENGRITAEQALDQLRYKKPNNQICIRNQVIIDKFVRFTVSEVI